MDAFNDLRLIQAYLIDWIKMIINLQTRNIIFAYVIYTFVLCMILSIISVLWGGGGKS